MADPRSSREVSGRVEIEFHKKPNRFKRLTWWTALALSIAAGVWVFYESAAGHTEIYQAGDISTPHAMFEQDCDKCHSLDTDILNLSPEQRSELTDGRWAPVRRLMGVFSGSERSPHSVSNANCEACHAGTTHHKNQFPEHGDGVNELSCAVCHREHEGDQRLAWVTNQHCIICHANLPEHTTDGSEVFAASVTDFGDEDLHPRFLIERLIKDQPDPATVAIERDERTGQPVHQAFHAVGHQALDGDEARWRDTARIRFNHAAHLKAMYVKDEESGEVRRVRGDRIDDMVRRSGAKAGELIGYPMNCTDCHEYDAAGEYIKPIVYERHCQECHPLTFDIEQFVELDGAAGKKRVPVTVPHESPEVVRGYLALAYRELMNAGERPAPAGVRNTQNPLGDLHPGLPGRDFEASLSAKQADTLFKELDEQSRELYPLDYLKQEVARRRGEQVLFKENGSCALCHDVRANPSAGDHLLSSPVQIVPPKIPQRWYSHSRFNHNTHRMLNCAHCHSDLGSGRPVWESQSTGDVLMPSTQSCRECHGQTASVVSGLARTARSDCVECHNYHSHAGEDFDGRLSLDRLLQKPNKSKGNPAGGTK